MRLEGALTESPKTAMTFVPPSDTHPWNPDGSLLIESVMRTHSCHMTRDLKSQDQQVQQRTGRCPEMKGNDAIFQR